MFPRLRTVAILAAAAGGPYVASETEWGRSTIASVSNGLHSDMQFTSTSWNGSGPGYAGNSHHEVEQLRRVDPNRYRYETELAEKLGAVPQDPNHKPKLVGVPISDPREVLRFDITPNWVIGRFARVSTVLADLKLEGLRVPIVSGTSAQDVAGTLTYYFDHRDTLQRITFHGFTGDPTRLVGLMTQHYGLAAEQNLEAGVYTKRWNGNPVHFLRLTHAPVVYSDSVHQKYTVFLELNQPNLAYGISPEARRVVSSDHHSGRW